VRSLTYIEAARKVGILETEGLDDSSSRNLVDKSVKSGRIPPMKLIADQKRRVVLPKSVKPGDALDVISTGDVIILHLLKPVPRGVPPVSPNPVSRDLLAGVDLDAPEFEALSNEGVA
jgi:hypothetical protein